MYNNLVHADWGKIFSTIKNATKYRRSLLDIQTTCDCEVNYHLFVRINTKTWLTYWYTQFACCWRHKTADAKSRAFNSAMNHVLMLWLIQSWNWYNKSFVWGFQKLKIHQKVFSNKNYFDKKLILLQTHCFSHCGLNKMSMLIIDRSLFMLV